MRRFLRTTSKVTVGLFAGSAVAFAVFYAVLVAGGYRPVAVYSGSMTPTISAAYKTAKATADPAKRPTVTLLTARKERRIVRPTPASPTR